MIKAINYFNSSSALLPPQALPPDHCQPASVGAPRKYFGFCFLSSSELSNTPLLLFEWKSFWFTLDTAPAAAERRWQRNICLCYSASTPDSTAALLFFRDWDYIYCPFEMLSCLSEWSGAACIIDNQCPGDAVPVCRSELSLAHWLWSPEAASGGAVNELSEENLTTMVEIHPIVDNDSNNSHDKSKSKPNEI